MDDSNQACGWRKGYPTEEMIAAHSLRLWLVKRPREVFMLKLPSRPERIQGKQLDNIIELNYYLDTDNNGKVTIGDENYKYWLTDNKYTFYLFEEGKVEIHCRYEDECLNDHCDLSFIGHWNGCHVEKSWLDMDYYGIEINFVSHAETILNLLQKEEKLGRTKPQRIYAEDYFCPIDEDGNKVPWPGSNKKEDE